MTVSLSLLSAGLELGTPRAISCTRGTVVQCYHRARD